ncbi:hypothetical protein [Burkholderia sp. LMG 21824]|uniref:hypothetical protein n=1 Tax=Burkholderia sp. LMG 21824 TaxID=3158172 RepID=UPI003C30CF50
MAVIADGAEDVVKRGLRNGATIMKRKRQIGFAEAATLGQEARDETAALPDRDEDVSVQY